MSFRVFRSSSFNVPCVADVCEYAHCLGYMHATCEKTRKRRSHLNQVRIGCGHREVCLFMSVCGAVWCGAYERSGIRRTETTKINT